VLWTVFRTPEKPPADMAAFERRRQATKGLAFGSREIADAIMRMPATMKQLFWVQFFTWFGLSCFWGFFTLAVAHHVFGVTDSKNPLFDRATEWAGMCMAAYSVVCFAVAPILSRLSGALGRPRIHSLALLLGGIGICSILFIHTKQPLMLSMVGFGIAWASILALPYAILSVALPPERVGVYMGIFNFFIVLPQAAASLFLQPIVKYVFHEDPVRVVMMGGVCFFIAALLALRVVEHVAEPTVSTGPAIAEGRVEEVVGAPS
jgi:maltose/moltooligosaccharide transporter